MNEVGMKTIFFAAVLGYVSERIGILVFGTFEIHFLPATFFWLIVLVLWAPGKKGKRR